jgi:hypothetical protein
MIIYGNEGGNPEDVKSTSLKINIYKKRKRHPVEK